MVFLPPSSVSQGGQTCWPAIWQSKDASASATSPATTVQESLGAAGGDVGLGHRCSGLLRRLPSKASSNEAAGVSCAACSDATETSGRIAAEQAVKDTWGLMDRPLQEPHATNHSPKTQPKGQQGYRSWGKPCQPELLLTFPTCGTGVLGLSHPLSP